MGDVSQLTPAVAVGPSGGSGSAGIFARVRCGRRITVAGRRLRKFFTRLVREQPLGTAGGIVILLLVLVSIFADGLAPYRYQEIHLRDRLQGPRRSTCWAPTTRGATC